MSSTASDGSEEPPVDGGAVDSGSDGDSGDHGRSDSDGYVVRPYEDTDRAAFLDLFETVFGERKSPEWFDWKYERNPYTDGVSVLVSEHEGDLVGARSFFGLRLGDGSRTYDALQPCDTMVHPDHRRRGLFTRMTERAIERYEADYDLFFNFPNHLSQSGYEKFGWESVQEVPQFHRVQGLDAFVDLPEGLPGRVVDAAGRAVAGTYLALRSRRGRRLAADVEVSRHERVPAETLADCYLTAVPDELHAVRDAEFYRWRFSNPTEYVTYVATDEGTAVGALVVAVDESGGVVNVMDVQPLADEASVPVYAALLARVVTEFADASLLAVRGRMFPKPVLGAFGFHADDTPPLSFGTTGMTHLTYSLQDDGSWSLAGHTLTDPDEWLVGNCEYDVL